MPTEKEVGLRIEDFMGINSLVSSEDLQDQFYKKSQNLYERVIGELQPRGGSALLSNQIPSNIIDMKNGRVFYDKQAGKYRIAKVQCDDPDFGNPVTLASVSAAFVAGGSWGKASSIANAFIGTNAIALVATGFGLKKRINSLITAGLPVRGDAKTLRVSIATPINNPNLTGIDVYAKVKYDFATTKETWSFVGHIDVDINTTGDFDFPYGPVYMPSDPGAPQVLGTTFATYTLTGATNGGGTLVSGKTYYVSLMSLHLNYEATDANCRYEWKSTGYTAITLSSGTTIQNSISVNISSMGADNEAVMLAIGTHPQLMMPVQAIANNTRTFTILSLPVSSLNVVGVQRTGASTSAYRFIVPDWSYREMLARFYSDGTMKPMVVANYLGFNQMDAVPPGDATWNGFISAAVNFVIEGVSLTAVDLPAAGYGPGNSDYSFEQYYHMTQDLMFMTAKDHYYDLTKHSIGCSDGNVAVYAVFDYGSCDIPPTKFLRVFKERLISGGGPTDAWNKAYGTLVLNPFNFGLAAAPTLPMYIQIESSGEEITGFGLYTNTTGQSGPIEQLVTTKLNSTWLISDWPYGDTAASSNGTMVQLSGRIGCVGQETIKNTDIGLIMTHHDGVYLVREDGEPTPIGDEIRNELRPLDPSATQDFTYWNAVYHDGHYKLSYSINGATVPSRELWLDVRKFKQTKTPCWQGPHDNRNIYYSFVERPFLDNIQEKRIIIDKQGTYSILPGPGYTFRPGYADSVLLRTDFGVNYQCFFDPRNFPLSDPNTNKLHTRTYWRLRVDQTFNFTEVTTAVNDAGVQSETKTRSAPVLAGHVGGSFNTFLTANQKQYAYFPTARIRGETMSKSFSYSGQVYFAISGFTIFYKIENRRIT